MVKNLPANAGDTGSIPRSERSPGEGNGKLLQYSCLQNFHAQRNLASYSPRGCKGLNTTEHTHTQSPGSIIWLCVCVFVTQSCCILCNPVDCSLPGSSVHGILQARIPQWVAISSCRGSSRPRDRTCVSCIGRLILYH